MPRVVSVPAPHDRIVQKQHDKQCANRRRAVMREHPSGDGIRLISVNAGGSIPPSRMSPGRSRTAGSTSGYCPIHDAKEKALKPSIFQSGTWSHRMSEWAILITTATERSIKT